jgi:hypothetical protein
MFKAGIVRAFLMAGKYKKTGQPSPASRHSDGRPASCTERLFQAPDAFYN